MKRHFLFSLLCLSLLTNTLAIAGDNCTTLESFAWLQGDWVIEGDTKTMRESWSRVGPMTFEGVNETHGREAGELRARETMRLLDMSDGIFYLAKVSENEYPVPFKLTKCSSHQAVFENPHHDFPRKLDYSLKDADTLEVHVSDGAGEGFTLSFRRSR